MRRVLLLLGIGVMLLDACLWATDRLSGVGAVVLFLGVEIILLGGYVLVSWRQGISPTTALPPLTWFGRELNAWRDLHRLLRGRVVVPAGAVPLTARQDWWQLPTMFTVAIVIEIIAVELLLPWPTLRVVLLVASLYSLPVLWGLVAERVVHPHYLGEDLVLRRGRREVLRVPAGDIDRVRAVRGFAAEDEFVVEKQLILGGTTGTNVEIHLTDGRSVALWLDEPAALTGMKSAD